METIDKHRTRAADAKDLIQYFLEFQKGNYSRMDALRRENVEGERKAAIVSRRLNTISKEIDLPGTELVVLNLTIRHEQTSKNTVKGSRRIFCHTSIRRTTMEKKKG